MRLFPLRQLEPLEHDNQVYVHGKGKYKVQLEVPNGSGLTTNDIGRILSIASWEGGSIDDKVEGYEGGRSVLITRENPYVHKDVDLPGLQIAGVGHKRFKTTRVRGAYLPEDSMQPPTTHNFLDYFKDDEGLMSTSVIRDGILTSEKQKYSPLGTYTEQRIRHKVANTRLAGTLPVSFSVPKVEAYGRYFNLSRKGQHMGFIVFTVPHVGLSRFAEQFISGAIGSEMAFNQFYNYSAWVMHVLAKSLLDLHKAGYAHKQPHASNFYYVNKHSDPTNHTVHLMDWSTMTPIVEDENGLMNKVIDIQSVHETFYRLFCSLYDPNPIIYIGSSFGLLSRYFGYEKSLDDYNDALAHYMELVNTPKLSDFEIIVEMLRRELHRGNQTKS